MDWKKTYFQLVETRKRNETPSDYHEQHHIVPKSEGGSNSPDNLVSLTVREHYVAHLLLARIYDDQKMWCAVKLMTPKGFKHSSRLYAAYRKKQQAWNKGIPCPDKMRKRISTKLKGRKLAESTKRKMSESKSGVTSNFFGRHHSDSTKKRIASKLKGLKKPEGYTLKQAMKQGRKIIQLTIDGEFVAEFCSSGEATRRTGITNIRRAVGSGGRAGGFIWKWA